MPIPAVIICNEERLYSRNSLCRQKFSFRRYENQMNAAQITVEGVNYNIQRRQYSFMSVGQGGFSGSLNVNGVYLQNTVDHIDADYFPRDAILAIYAMRFIQARIATIVARLDLSNQNAQVFNNFTPPPPVIFNSLNIEHINGLQNRINRSPHLP